jgi:hypothetical protein
VIAIEAKHLLDSGVVEGVVSAVDNCLREMRAMTFAATCTVTIPQEPSPTIFGIGRDEF